MKITIKYLRERMIEVNRLLGRPESMFLPIEDVTDGRMSVGHLDVDYNYNGYQIEEIVSAHGAAHNHTHRLTGKEMDCYISGLLAGIALKNKV